MLHGIHSFYSHEYSKKKTVGIVGIFEMSSHIFWIPFQIFIFPINIYCCEEPQFQCHIYDHQCLNDNQVCDGWVGCYGGEDEANCHNYTCLPGYRKCDDNLECKKETSVCDSYFDCSDFSDESHCTEWECVEGYRKCDDNKWCLNVERVCDGSADCEDESDERNCQHWNCTKGRACWIYGLWGFIHTSILRFIGI